MRLTKALLIAYPLCVLAAFAACSKDTVNKKTYTYGPTSQTGSVVSADISLVRRGTHMLRVNGEDMFYMESKTENLQEYAGQTVYVQGKLEPNTRDTHLPVLVVEKLISRQQAITPHEWRIPVLGIVITTPDTWDATINNEIVTFGLKGSGSGEEMLTVTRKPGTTMPQGESIFAAGGHGIRVRDANSGLQDVYVAGAASTTIRLHFTPDASLDTDELATLTKEFDDVVRSVRLLTSGTNASGATTGSGATNMPCGGSAGILCPAGQYCEVIDTATNVGKCRKP